MRAKASRPHRARASRLRQRLEREIDALRALEGRRSRWGEAWAYHLEGQEILHFHGDHEIDLRLTRAVIRAERERLTADPRVWLGDRQREWVEVSIATAADLPFLVNLVKQAIRANWRSH